MKNRKFSGIVLTSIVLIAVTGCIPQAQYDDLKAQNRIQQQHITDLESSNSACAVEKEQMNKQLASLRTQTGSDIGFKDSEITALERDLENKKKLISKMQAQLLRSGVALPMELSITLTDFAKNNEMVTFDESSGMLKFKSDLLFESGSDMVAPKAIQSIKSFCDIMNTKEAEGFDIIVAGHTDDVPIEKPATKAKHPTNWHLSVHRAISVLNTMAQNKIDSKRISVRGFGQFRPAAENKPGRKGNAANRRVEILIVPAGA